MDQRISRIIDFCMKSHSASSTTDAKVCIPFVFITRCSTSMFDAQLLIGTSVGDPYPQTVNIHSEPEDEYVKPCRNLASHENDREISAFKSTFLSVRTLGMYGNRK